eukprot:2355296-Prymnesium_polylepis.2
MSACKAARMQVSMHASQHACKSEHIGTAFTSSVLRVSTARRPASSTSSTLSALALTSPRISFATAQTGPRRGTAVPTFRIFSATSNPVCSKADACSPRSSAPSTRCSADAAKPLCVGAPPRPRTARWMVVPPTMPCEEMVCASSMTLPAKVSTCASGGKCVLAWTTALSAATSAGGSSMAAIPSLCRTNS